MKILVLGDIHLPSPDWAALKEAYEYNKKYKADVIVCVGDITDQKTWSKYGRDTDDPGNNEEWAQVTDTAKRVARLFPKMRIILGNHDIRYFKAANLAGIPSQLIRSVGDALGIPGWHFHDTSDGPLVIDRIAFVHGDEQSGRVEAKASFLGMSTVQGHTHKAHLEYLTNPFGKTIFGLDVGCLADVKGRGMRYASKMLRKAWVGFATISKGHPVLFPKGSTR